jgi:hypothetical protein
MRFTPCGHRGVVRRQAGERDRHAARDAPGWGPGKLTPQNPGEEFPTTLRGARESRIGHAVVLGQRADPLDGLDQARLQ